MYHSTPKVLSVQVKMVDQYLSFRSNHQWAATILQMSLSNLLPSIQMAVLFSVNEFLKKLLGGCGAPFSTTTPREMQRLRLARACCKMEKQFSTSYSVIPTRAFSLLLSNTGVWSFQLFKHCGLFKDKILLTIKA